MGRDKAWMRVAGEPLWRRQVRILRTAGATPVFVARREGQEKVGWGIRQVWDEFADAGPMAGLHAVLKAAATETRWVAVAAVDMPALDAAWFRHMRKLCRPGVGAVARHADGFEPLAAVYSREALATVTRRLRRRELSMQRLVAALVRSGKLTVMELPEAERWRMKNWNRPSDR